jgi:hypothetical protein
MKMMIAAALLTLFLMGCSREQAHEPGTTEVIDAKGNVYRNCKLITYGGYGHHGASFYDSEGRRCYVSGSFVIRNVN